MARGFETLRHDILSLGTTTSQTIDIPTQIPAQEGGYSH